MQVNGKELDLSVLKEKSISCLLSHFEIEPGVVAIEKNGDMVDRDFWKEHSLGENDRIEIIKFVGGG